MVRRPVREIGAGVGVGAGPTFTTSYFAVAVHGNAKGLPLAAEIAAAASAQCAPDTCVSELFSEKLPTSLPVAPPEMSYLSVAMQSNDSPRLKGSVLKSSAELRNACAAPLL